MLSCYTRHSEDIGGLTPISVLLAAGLVLLGLAALIAPAEAAAQPQATTPTGQGEQIFQTKCSGCHTIGKGKLVGPDLAGVGTRRDRQWMKNFISNPESLFAANDPTATGLLREYNNLKMPTLGLSAAEVDSVVAFLETTSAASTAATPAGAAQPAAAAGAGATTPIDAATGQRIFTGEQRLQNGGPACTACHTVSGTGGLGGGSLGPDLTHVAARYGEAGLAGVLQNIAFPTMAGPFTSKPLSAQEQVALVAYFVQADQAQAPVPVFSPGALTPQTWRVLGIALGGTVVLFGLLLLFWPRQRESVSARLRRRSAGRDA